MAVDQADRDARPAPRPTRPRGRRRARRALGGRRLAASASPPLLPRLTAVAIRRHDEVSSLHMSSADFNRLTEGSRSGYLVPAVDSLRGQLLVAGPRLLDPNFHRTVVLVCEHDDDGAMGLVLNRPSPIPADQAIPELGEALEPEDRCGSAGRSRRRRRRPRRLPRRRTRAMRGLRRRRPRPARRRPGRASPPRSSARGRSWASPAGAPTSSTGRSSATTGSSPPFGPRTPSPTRRSPCGRTVLGRKGGEYALLATMPPDPSVN